MSMNDVHAPEKVRCPSCGAKNAPGAAWCGQCLKRFDTPPAPPTAPIEPPATPPSDAVPTAPPPAREGAPAVKPGIERGSFRSTEEGIFWRCSACDAENPLDAASCGVCGTSFGDALKPPAPARPERDPGTVAMASLFFPGAGHAYLGMWPQAIARAVVSVWVGLMALFFAVGGKSGSIPVAILFALVAFGLWMVAAHDAYKEATHAPREVLLYGRRFTYLVLGLLMLLLASLFLTAFANR